MTDNDLDPSRRNFLLGATGVVGAAGVAGVAVPFLGSWNPSAKALAAGAPIKIDISKVRQGELLGPIPAWRDRPIFVVKRSKETLTKLSEKTDRLADPKSEESEQPEYARNDTRSIKPDILVLVGLCTHLKCSPKFKPVVQPEDFDPNWLGGFYCPCHGSKFDMAGRVYAGVPAPSNLPVPPHFYESDTILVIGEDEGGVS
ncbi:MAG: ubiquinol-cytochrome c reductase iron-sulfur subunit [Gammaproteobacteria bacterium]|nr:ubiquinol-cytochrome c reductase iron-sulfur subunit [Gammaproteobacteria bacterium]